MKLTAKLIFISWLMTVAGWSQKLEAAVLFDQKSATGFVDAREITSTFGWTSEELLQKYIELDFAYAQTEQIIAVCSWIDPASGKAGFQDKYLEIKSSYKLLATPVFEDKFRKKILLFNLTGYESEFESVEEPPKVGQQCITYQNVYGTWTSVRSTHRIGGLHLIHRGMRVLLPN
jgi:hypothetical protein